MPLKQLSGHFALSGSDVTVTRLSAKAGDRLVTGDYRYNTGPGRTERVHLKLDAADISEVQQAFAPALRPSGFLACFRFGRRSLPAWLHGSKPGSRRRRFQIFGGWQRVGRPAATSSGSGPVCSFHL